MRLEISRQDIYALREGDLRNMSDNRLFLIAERLGDPVHVHVGPPMEKVLARDLRGAFPPIVSEAAAFSAVLDHAAA